MRGWEQSCRVVWNPLGFIDPAVLGGKNIITGSTATTGLQQGGFSVTPTGTYQSLTSEIDANKSIIPGEAALVGPSSWVSQPQLLRRVGFTLFLASSSLGMGCNLLTRGDAPNLSLPSLPSPPLRSRIIPPPKPMTNPVTDFTRSGVVGRSKASGSKFLTGE